MMEKEVIECLEKTEQNNDTCMSYVIKHNGLKSKSEEIRNVELLENEIVVLEAKKNNCFEQLLGIVMLCYVCLNSDEKNVHGCVLDI